MADIVLFATPFDAAAFAVLLVMALTGAVAVVWAYRLREWLTRPLARVAGFCGAVACVGACLLIAAGFS